MWPTLKFAWQLLRLCGRHSQHGARAARAARRGALACPCDRAHLYRIGCTCRQQRTSQTVRIAMQGSRTTPVTVRVTRCTARVRCNSHAVRSEKTASTPCAALAAPSPPAIMTSNRKRRTVCSPRSAKGSDKAAARRAVGRGRACGTGGCSRSSSTARAGCRRSADCRIRTWRAGDTRVQSIYHQYAIDMQSIGNQ